MRYPAIRALAAYLKKTPFHPQWLLQDNRISGAWVRQNARGTVLDIGCASRWIERWLGHDTQYVGIDYPQTGTEIYGAEPHVFADASRLPLRDASIDTVVFLEVCEHLYGPCEALQEIGRVLRPSGKLLMSMPFLYPIHDAPHDYQRLTIHGLRRSVGAAGLTIQSITPALGSCETAGLIACIALAGVGLRAIELRRPSIVLLPLLLLAIPAVNVFAWVVGKLMPSWEGITSGYRVCAVKAAAAVPPGAT